MPRIVTDAAPTHAPYAPELDNGGDEDQAPDLAPEAAYLLKVHPERWTVMEGEVVPLCGKLKLYPGVNNVRAVKLPNGKTQFRTRAAEAEAEAQGWKVLKFDVDGPGTSYLHEPRDGVFLSRWETPHPRSKVVTVDTAGYVAWLRGLIERGAIARPKAYVLERMAERLRGELGEMLDKVHGSPSLRPRIERTEADIAAIEAELEKIATAPATPTPQAPGPDLLASDDLADEEAT